tara:strand:+ start:480 stop:824 length:345 start_codon:yes stop_codon:yes gene_type:complete
MENYLYFCDTTDEPNATDEAMLIPASKVLGIHPGRGDGLAGDFMTLHFEALSNTGAAEGEVKLTITSGKFIDACDDLVAAMNSTPGDGFVNIADAQNGLFCSSYITACVITTEV